MKQYMVVTYGGGETWATFFDTLASANEYKFKAGYYWHNYSEVYERVETERGHEYVLIYA
jgi:hypothetical protein